MHGKKEQEKIDKFFAKAFDKMFSMVGEKFDYAFLKQPFWYTQHEWAKGAETDFEQWFISEYRQYFKKNKAYAQDEAKWFLFNYGWKTKD